MGDDTAIENLDLEIIGSEIHDMMQVNYQLALFGKLENPLRAIIPTGRCVENLLLIVLDKKQGLHATREHNGGNGPQDGALNQIRGDNGRLINVQDYLPRHGICNPGILIDIPEIQGGVVNRIRHIAEVDVEHVNLARFQMLVVEVLVDELAGGDALEVLPVLGLAVALGAGRERLAVDPAVLVGDLLQHGHGHVLGALHGADELARLVEGLHGAGVEPRVAAPEGHHGQQPVLQVHAVEVGDLELAAGGGDDPLGAPAHVARVEVQAGDGVAGLGVLGLLLDGDGVEVGVELHDAEALGVVDVVAEHGGEPLRLGVLNGAAEVPSQAVAVEDVVAEDERAGLPSGELLAYHEGLREAVGAGLDGVGQVHAVVRPVAQEALEVREVGGGRDDQDVADAGHHEDGQRVVDHRLVVDRQQLLAGDGGERVQAGAGPAGEDDALHGIGSLCRRQFDEQQYRLHLLKTRIRA